MIQITLKARHFYYISYYLRDKSIQNYYFLINKISTALAGNTDEASDFTISATVNEMVDIFKLLTFLPEGQANSINVEMDDMLLPQIKSGISSEIANGTVPDRDGNLPDNAYWQLIAQGISIQKNASINVRNSAIQAGKLFIDQI